MNRLHHTAGKNPSVVRSGYVTFGKDTLREKPDVAQVRGEQLIIGARLRSCTEVTQLHGMPYAKGPL